MDDIIGEILEREGGFVDHAMDRGGPTNLGVTLPTLSQWLGRPATIEDLKALTEADARSLYQDLYITQPGFGVIPNQRLMGLVVDMGVNHGPKKAIQMLQKALGVKDDGVLGDKTKAAIQAADFRSLYLKACAERIRLYGRIITKDKTQAVFAAGWLNRAAEFVEKA